MIADSFLQLNREAPNVRYVKVEGASPGPLISAIIAGPGGTIKCLIGYGGLQLVDGLQCGAVGVQPASGVADYYPHILKDFEGDDLDGAYDLHADLLPLVNLLMQAIEPLNRLEKIILKRPGIIAHDYCRAVSYEPDDFMLAELGCFVDRIAAKLHRDLWSRRISAVRKGERTLTIHREPPHPEGKALPAVEGCLERIVALAEEPYRVADDASRWLSWRPHERG